MKWQNEIITIFMARILPGDLVKIQPHSSAHAVDVQAYRINNMDQLNLVLNKADKIVSVSNAAMTGLKIPNIDAQFCRLEREQIGLYLGFVNVEDYGRVYLYYAVLLEKNVFMIKDEGVKLVLGKRETQKVV